MFPEYGISERDAKYIGDAAALHDIGKALIPPSILFKAGKLTDDELKTMGLNGRRLMEEQYSVESIAEKMKSLYEWILDQGSKPDFVYLK